LHGWIEVGTIDDVFAAGEIVEHLGWITAAAEPTPTAAAIAATAASTASATGWITTAAAGRLCCRCRRNKEEDRHC